MTAQPVIPGTVRVGEAQYGRPFRDHAGRLMVSVYCDDGDRYVTYGVADTVRQAWQAVDRMPAR